MDEYWSQSSETESSCHQFTEYSESQLMSNYATTFQTGNYNYYQDFSACYYSSSSSEIEDKPELEDFSSELGEIRGTTTTEENQYDAKNSSNCTITTKWQRKRAYELTLPLHIRQKRRSAANAR